MTTPAHLIKTARRQLRKIRLRGASSENEKRLVASADAQRAEGLGFRYDGFDDVPTPELFAMLRKVGLDWDEESFRRGAAVHGSPTALSSWWLQRTTAEGRWKDLVILGFRELWARLLPHVRSAEVTSDALDRHYGRHELSPSEAEPLEEGLRVVLKDCRGPDGSYDRPFFERVAAESGFDLKGWLLEVPARLFATPAAPRLPDDCLALSQLLDSSAMLAERAEMLARLGRVDEALAQLEALLAEHAHEPIVLLKAGAIHEQLGDFAKAQAYLKAYTELMRSPEAAPAIEAASKAKIPLTPVQRVGPNDPCPCGSGSKFKKCHGLRS